MVNTTPFFDIIDHSSTSGWPGAACSTSGEECNAQKLHCTTANHFPCNKSRDQVTAMPKNCTAQKLHCPRTNHRAGLSHVTCAHTEQPLVTWSVTWPVHLDCRLDTWPRTTNQGTDPGHVMCWKLSYWLIFKWMARIEKCIILNLAKCYDILQIVLFQMV